MTNLPEESESTPQSLEPDLAGLDVAQLAQTALGDPDSSQPSPGQWEPPTPEELAPFLPAFAIESTIGRGGMGAVYKAVQKSLDRSVALKLLPPELSADPEFEARFKREAKAMAQLNHPNIVQIYDFGQTDGGHYYFVMEFVEGVDLHHFIREGNLDAEGALNAVSQICDALNTPTKKDLFIATSSPPTFFLNTGGILKVGDFGLAKLAGGEALSETEQVGLTMTGVSMGTPHYIAPEQLSGETATDHRADIYSLGVMFYEMLTGDLPRGAFKAPSERNAILDIRIDGVVYRAMDSDPSDRYQSAADLRTDVDSIRLVPVPVESVEEEGKDDRGRQNPKLSPAIWVSTVVVPVLLLGGLIWWLGSGREGASQAEGKSQQQQAPAGKDREADSAELAKVPGLSKRLEAYLKTRTEKLSALASQYGKALETRLNAAADAGNLKLARAYQKEKTALADLNRTLSKPGPNPVETTAAGTSLPDLAEEAPDELKGLRKTWTTEHDKIRADLDGKLDQSLRALEGELTKARDFAKAELVMGYREGVAKERLNIAKTAVSTAKGNSALSASLRELSVHSGCGNKGKAF